MGRHQFPPRPWLPWHNSFSGFTSTFLLGVYFRSNKLLCFPASVLPWNSFLHRQEPRHCCSALSPLLDISGSLRWDLFWPKPVDTQFLTLPRKRTPTNSKDVPGGPVRSGRNLTKLCPTGMWKAQFVSLWTWMFRWDFQAKSWRCDLVSSSCCQWNYVRRERDWGKNRQAKMKQDLMTWEIVSIAWT